MTSLEHLGNRKPFCQFETDTNMSTGMHRYFFKYVFLAELYACRAEWIYFPPTMAELHPIMRDYKHKYLPGCAGSIDVVHCKWAHCPAGDRVKAKGKEQYPSQAFECVTNNHRKILGTAPVQFGSRNDQHIVRLDPTVRQIRKEWYKDIEWECFDLHGVLHKCRGVYLICDGGYLRWRTLICPYQYAHNASVKGYWSTNLESVRKDVECTFGIMKKRWRILEYGIHYRCIVTSEKIFVVCAILHNMLINEIDWSESDVPQVGRSVPKAGDAIYLEGPTDRDAAEPVSRSQKRNEKKDGVDWAARREQLSEHHAYCKKKNTI
jgi:hypothetical protein